MWEKKSQGYEYISAILLHRRYVILVTRQVWKIFTIKLLSPWSEKNKKYAHLPAIAISFCKQELVNRPSVAPSHSLEGEVNKIKLRGVAD